MRPKTREPHSLPTELGGRQTGMHEVLVSRGVGAILDLLLAELRAKKSQGLGFVLTPIIITIIDYYYYCYSYCYYDYHYYDVYA